VVLLRRLLGAVRRRLRLCAFSAGHRRQACPLPPLSGLRPARPAPPPCRARRSRRRRAGDGAGAHLLPQLRLARGPGTAGVASRQPVIRQQRTQQFRRRQVARRRCLGPLVGEGRRAALAPPARGQNRKPTLTAAVVARTSTPDPSKLSNSWFRTSPPTVQRSFSAYSAPMP